MTAVLIDVAALLEAVRADAPGGSDPREGEAFEALQAELDRLTNPSASGVPDWRKVEQRGSELLRTEGKDFLVAAWLSAAWIDRAGIDGFGAGLQLMAGLAERHWEDGFPSIKRLRGRRNALQWWLDRSSAWLEQARFDALEPEVQTRMADAAKRLHALLGERDPEAPSLSQLITAIDHFDVRQEAPPAPPAMVEAPAAPAVAAAAPAPISAPPVAAMPALAMPAAGSLSSLDEVARALEPLRQGSSVLAEALQALAPEHPAVVELTRFAARGGLLEMPPSSGRTTTVPPVPDAVRQAFDAVCAAGNAQGIAAFCESRLPAYPFWLDLDCRSAQAWQQQGPSARRLEQAAVDHALAFVDRWPALVEACFSDGSPFADARTQAWLADCRGRRGGGVADESPFGQAAAEAARAQAQGGGDAAAKVYQQLIAGSRSGRDRFRAHVALVDMWLLARPAEDARALLQPLLDEVDRHQLARWEPELAAQAWRLQCRACRAVVDALAARGDSASVDQATEHWRQALARLAEVDFGAAAELSRST